MVFRKPLSRKQTHQVKWTLYFSHMDALAHLGPRVLGFGLNLL